MKANTAWKFLQLKDGVIVSEHDNSPWAIGKWREVPAPTQACVGLNCSLLIDDAHSCVSGSVVAKVEYKGVVVDGGDKLTCQYMRIKAAWFFMAPAWKAYQEAKATAWRAYQEATAPAWRAYQEAKAPAWRAYQEATAPAWKAYQEAMAPAWRKILRTCEKITPATLRRKAGRG
jgi:hypothetical protein